MTKCLATVLLVLLLTCSTLTSLSAQTHSSNLSSSSGVDNTEAIAASRALKMQWDYRNYQYERLLEESSKLFLAKLFVIYKEKGLFTKQSGSAFLIRYNGMNYFLSANHIFFDDKENPLLQDFNTIVMINRNRFYFTKKDVYLDSVNDVMIAKAPDSLSTDLVLDAELKFNNGTKVISFGYSDGDFLASEGTIKNIDNNFTTLDCLVYLGSSGGPIVFMGEQKKLLGIITDFADDNMNGTKSPSLKIIVKDIKAFDKIHSIR